MFLEWIAELGLLPREPETDVLGCWPLSVRRALIAETTQLFRPDGPYASGIPVRQPGCTSAKADETLVRPCDTLTSMFHAKVALELVGQALLLPLEDVGVMRNAVSIYASWLLEADTRPAAVRRAPDGDSEQWLIQTIVKHLSNLFHPRSLAGGTVVAAHAGDRAAGLSHSSATAQPQSGAAGELPPPPGPNVTPDDTYSSLPYNAQPPPAAAHTAPTLTLEQYHEYCRRYGELCKTALKVLNMAVRSLAGSFSPATWATLLRTLLGCADFVLRLPLHPAQTRPGHAAVLAPGLEGTWLAGELCEPLIRILMEAWLRSQTTNVELWDRLRTLFQRWTHRHEVVELWGATVVGLTQRVLRMLYGPGEGADAVAISVNRYTVQLAMPDSVVVYAWHQTLNLLPSPVTLSPSNFSLAIHGVAHVVHCFQAVGASADPLASGAYERTAAVDINTLLHMFGPWLFAAAGATASAAPPSRDFCAGRAEALRVLCTLFADPRLRRTAPQPTYLHQFYATLQNALRTECPDALFAVVTGSQDLFLSELPGVRLLVPDFVRAVLALLPVTELPAVFASRVSLQSVDELRHAAYRLWATLVPAISVVESLPAELDGADTPLLQYVRALYGRAGGIKPSLAAALLHAVLVEPNVANLGLALRLLVQLVLEDAAACPGLPMVAIHIVSVRTLGDAATPAAIVLAGLDALEQLATVYEFVRRDSKSCLRDLVGALCRFAQALLSVDLACVHVPIVLRALSVAQTWSLKGTWLRLDVESLVLVVQTLAAADAAALAALRSCRAGRSADPARPFAALGPAYRLPGDALSVAIAQALQDRALSARPATPQPAAASASPGGPALPAVMLVSAAGTAIPLSSQNAPASVLAHASATPSGLLLVTPLGSSSSVFPSTGLAGAASAAVSTAASPAVSALGIGGVNAAATPLPAGQTASNAGTRHASVSAAGKLFTARLHGGLSRASGAAAYSASQSNLAATSAGPPSGAFRPASLVPQTPPLSSITGGLSVLLGGGTAETAQPQTFQAPQTTAASETWHSPPEATAIHAGNFTETLSRAAVLKAAVELLVAQLLEHTDTILSSPKPRLALTEKRPPFAHFALDGRALLAVRNAVDAQRLCAPLDTSNATPVVDLVIRTFTGMTCWTGVLEYETLAAAIPDEKDESPPLLPVDESADPLEAAPTVAFQPASFTTLGPETKLLETLHEEPTTPTTPKPPLEPALKPKARKDGNMHAARQTLLGLILGDSVDPARLVRIDADSEAALALDLDAIDALPARKQLACAVLAVDSVSEPLLAPFLRTTVDRDLDEFVASLGWTVRVASHRGFSGGLTPELCDTLPFYMNRGVELAFQVPHQCRIPTGYSSKVANVIPLAEIPPLAFSQRLQTSLLVTYAATAPWRPQADARQAAVAAAALAAVSQHATAQSASSLTTSAAALDATSHASSPSLHSATGQRGTSSSGYASPGSSFLGSIPAITASATHTSETGRSAASLWRLPIMALVQLYHQAAGSDLLQTAASVSPSPATSPSQTTPQQALAFAGATAAKHALRASAAMSTPPPARHASSLRDDPGASPLSRSSSIHSGNTGLSDPAVEVEGSAQEHFWNHLVAQAGRKAVEFVQAFHALAQDNPIAIVWLREHEHALLVARRLAGLAAFFAARRHALDSSQPPAPRLRTVLCVTPLSGTDGLYAVRLVRVAPSLAHTPAPSPPPRTHAHAQTYGAIIEDDASTLGPLTDGCAVSRHTLGLLVRLTVLAEGAYDPRDVVVPLSHLGQSDSAVDIRAWASSALSSLTVCAVPALLARQRALDALIQRRARPADLGGLYCNLLRL